MPYLYWASGNMGSVIRLELRFIRHISVSALKISNSFLNSCAFFLLDARTFFWHFSAKTVITEISVAKDHQKRLEISGGVLGDSFWKLCPHLKTWRIVKVSKKLFFRYETKKLLWNCWNCFFLARNNNLKTVFLISKQNESKDTNWEQTLPLN